MCLTTEDKAGENLSQDNLNIPAGHDSCCQSSRLLQVARHACRSRSPWSLFGRLGPTLGQRICHVSEIRCSSHQPTWSRNSRLEILCGQKRENSQFLVNLPVTIVNYVYW